MVDIVSTVSNAARDAVHALLDQASQAYFGQVHMTLEGLTDGKAYEQAWNLLVERHSILRTRFAWEGLKEPVQLIQSEGSIHLTQHDVRHRWKRIGRRPLNTI